MQVPIEESSTNDATSSRQSTTNTSFSQSEAANTATAAAAGTTADHAKLNVLTTDGIIKECIKQGFYRNPICNEKLYLHNKSYDVVAPTAFDLYTDVKVLWLEGNALRSLPIGGAHIQTRPPKNKYAWLDEKEEEADEGREGEDAQAQLQAHVDPMQNINTVTEEEDSVPVDTKEQKQREKAEKLKREKIEGRRIKKEVADAAALLPEVHEIVDETQKDAFSSLYPTVRQLYLHNNLLRTMPDLHRFQLLDSVHLGNNFFSAVVPFCPFWDQKIEQVVEQLRREEGTNGEALAADTMRAVTDRLLEHLRQQHQEPPSSHLGAGEAGVTVQQQPEPRDGGRDVREAGANDGAVVLSTEAAEKQRDALLQLYKRLTERCYTLCEHAPIAVEDETGALPATIPTAQRCPCSTLRTLNLSQNRLSEFTDVLPLMSYHAITTLDLSGNQLHDGEALLLILEKLPRLLSLKLQGNPLTRTLRRYRQRVLSHCKKLVYLDDRPVFEDERRLVTAWAKGGDAAVNKERECIKEENEAKQKKRLDDFRALLANSRNAGGAGDDDNGAQRNNANSTSGDAYIAAVTTDEALAAAAAAAGQQPSRATVAVVTDTRGQIQSASRNARRAYDEEAADSPTSEDEEEEDSDGSSHTGHQVDENKVQESERRTESKERVLSTNRPPVAATTAATTTTTSAARGGATNANENEDDDDDIYIPSA